ncbi:MAG: hypothetical protein H7X86_13540 [Gorillibacterium sp.]|nr:hypothetical protein [Gorillibacterium sp.]
MSHSLKTYRQVIYSFIEINNSYFHLLTIWGLQWVSAAILTQLFIIGVPVWTVSASFWLAIAATVAYLLLLRVNDRNLLTQRPLLDHQKPTFSLVYKIALFTALLLLPAVILLMFHWNGILFVDLYRAALLAVLYLFLGMGCNRWLIYLGLWLLLLTFITTVFYLGFAPFILGLMGGLSLIASRFLLKAATEQVQPSATNR